MHNSSFFGAVPKPKICPFHEQDSDVIDYKNIALLRKYTSSYAKIVSQRRTGLCSKHQRQMAKAVKRARILALLPTTT